MARTKKFDTLHASLVSDKTNEIALRAGEHAIKAIYSNDDAEMALCLLNDTPQFMRKLFATWLRSYGVVVVNPAPGESAYVVGDSTGLVKDKKAQAKMFARLNADNAPDVLPHEIKARAIKKPKELKGDAKSRAIKKMEAVIKALRKEDPEAACFVNDTWGSKVEETEISFDDGEEFTLSAVEAAKVRNFILNIRGELREAA